MDGVAAGLFGGFVDGFTQSWVRVDGGNEFLVGGLHFDGESEFGDHFRGVGADDVGAEDFAVGFAEDDFHKAFAFADSERFAAGHEGEFADFVFQPLFLRGAFGHSDAGDLRLAVGATREDGDFARGFAGEYAFDRLDGFEAGHVGEPRGPDDITRGVDAAQGGFVAIVGLDPAFRIEIHLESFGHERRHADGDERHRCLEGFVGFAADREFDPFVGGLGFFHFGAGEEADTLFGQGFFQGDGDIRIFDREDVGQHFDHGDFRAERVEEVGEFDADGAGADDDDFLGLLGQDHGLFAADDAFAVKRKAGHFARDNSGGDEDFRGGVGGLFAFGVGDFDHAAFGNGGGAADVIDFVLFEEHFDAAGKFVGHAAAAADDFGPIEGKFVEGHAEVAGVFGHQLVKLGIAEERFGRDAAPVEAGAASAFHFNAGHFFAELRGADRADISGGSAADHDEIVCHKNMENACF